MTRINHERRVRVKPELPPTHRIIRLGWEGKCHGCEQGRRAGSRAVWDTALKVWYCWHCAWRNGWVKVAGA